MWELRRPASRPARHFDRGNTIACCRVGVEEDAARSVVHPRASALSRKACAEPRLQIAAAPHDMRGCICMIPRFVLVHAVLPIRAASSFVYPLQLFHPVSRAAAAVICLLVDLLQSSSTPTGQHASPATLVITSQPRPATRIIAMAHAIAPRRGLTLLVLSLAISSSIAAPQSTYVIPFSGAVYITVPNYTSAQQAVCPADAPVSCSSISEPD